MHEIAESSRLFEEKDSLYLSCWLLCYDSPIPTNSSVSFVITDKQFVSTSAIRITTRSAFSAARATACKTRRFQTQYGAFVELLDALAGHIASNLRLIEQDLNSLSIEIFSEQKSQQKNKALPQANRSAPRETKPR